MKKLFSIALFLFALSMVSCIDHKPDQSAVLLVHRSGAPMPDTVRVKYYKLLKVYDCDHGIFDLQDDNNNRIVSGISGYSILGDK